jgi:hypothetical protein
LIISLIIIYRKNNSSSNGIKKQIIKYDTIAFFMSFEIEMEGSLLKTKQNIKYADEEIIKIIFNRKFFI